MGRDFWPTLYIGHFSDTWLTFEPLFPLKVTIWGDYGRMEGKKVFMGVAQIMLDDLDLSNLVIGWYKLFGTSSLVSLPPNGPPPGASTAPQGPPMPQQQQPPPMMMRTPHQAGSVQSLDSF